MKTNREKEQKTTRVGILLTFLRGSKRFFALSLLFACLLVLFELVNPKVIGYTVDLCIGELSALPAYLLQVINAWGGRDYIVHHFYIPALVVIVISLIGALCRYSFQVFNAMGAEHLVKNMRDMLYEQIVQLPYSWLDHNRTGDIIQRCTSDVDMIKNFLSEQLTNLFRMIIMIVLAISFMAKIEWKLTLIAAAFIPIVILYSFFFHDRIGSTFEIIDNEEGRLSAIAQENLTGVRVVRAFGRERYERERFENQNTMYTGMWVKMMKLLSSFWAINDFITGVQVVCILSVGAYFAVKGNMSAGEYVAFLSYNTLLTFPVRQLGRVVSEMSKAGISIDRLIYIMDAQIEEDVADAKDYPMSGDIRFEHVSFDYVGEPVLADISFEIKSGETIGILGGTGAGKSTLVHLLTGLYPLKENCGTITIGGIDIKQIQKKQLREQIGIVLQEPYLFSRTIEENIKIAVPDEPHEAVEKAVEMASLDAAIAHFVDGYQTFVGERGVTLSGGQKQRTAIAQMLIRNPQVMIFDDSLSAVDAQTDAKIRKGLEEIQKETTVILISHRITTLMQADRIFVLEKGRLVEQGNHKELIQKGGIYKQIYDLQLSQGDEDYE